MPKTKNAPAVLEKPTAHRADTPVEPRVKATVDNALQANLLDYIKLGLCVKQAHWNLVGPTFFSLHEFLDKVYEDVQEFTDETAERIRQLQGFPNGNADAVAAQGTFEGMPLGSIRDADAGRMILNRLVTTIAVVRERLESFEETEVVTADLVHAQALELEKHAWMLRSYLGEE